VVGTNYAFHLAFSNIDENAPDGLRGDTEVEVEIRIAE
jgi:hypothetical protein